MIGARLPLAAPLRWRLHQVPLGLDLPDWVEVASVDLAYHLRGIALPFPGHRRAARGAPRLPLDRPPRARPRWECSLVHGLPGGRQALDTKVHHAALDGLSGAEIVAALMDLAPRAPRRPPTQGRPEAGHSARRRRHGRASGQGTGHPGGPGAGLRPQGGAASVPGAALLGTVAAKLGRLAGRASTDDLPPRPPTPPDTPFNGPDHRHPVLRVHLAAL